MNINEKVFRKDFGGLLGLNDEDIVVTQWQGKFKSDVFIFKAGEFKNYNKNK